MKKLIIVAIAASFGAAVVHAQVYSANIVGYNKTTTVPGLQILGTAFESDVTATPDSLFGDTLPYGSKVYKFLPPNGPYQIATYSQGFFGLPDSWDTTFELGPGTGYWVQLPSNTVENVFAGEVNTSDSVTNQIEVGFQILCNPYPVAMTVKEMGFAPAYGDKIFKFNAPNGPYSISTYNQGFFGLPDDWDADFEIGIGEGFWYQSQSNATDWVIDRPFATN